MKNEGKIDDLDFLSNNPGASKYGNFINYYKFHNIVERISSLHEDMLPPPTSNTIICLDIGCNSGDLTKEVFSCMKLKYKVDNIEMLAIDIDPVLISRAQEHNITNIKYATANIMKPEGQEVINKFLESHSKNCFDITFCFSVTMWIHINNADDGLLQFLSYIKTISRSIVIEPQPWKCYRNAQRRLKKSGSSFEFYDSLKIRSNVDQYIENNILEGNFKKVYESQSSSWDRRIQCFHCIE